MSEPLEWTPHGPRSARFDDIYYSSEDGLAETRHVFLDGCGLGEAFGDRDRFVIAELGFGTGLNCLAAAALWSERAGAGAGVLHLISVEAYPISREDAARALGGYPELAGLAAPLLRGWPRGRRGLHRYEWPDIGVILDLHIAEAAEGLASWTGRADAWFLDGFAPAKNPDMWRPEVLDLVACRSAPDARLATFTAAGSVRRALEARGFAMARRPGYGRKRESLHGRRLGAASPRIPSPHVVVIGAGIAGAALARAFGRLGAKAVVVDAAGAGAGASGNPSALVTPRVDAGGGRDAALFAAAFARAVDLYRLECPEAVIAEGVLILARDAVDAARFEKVADQGLFDAGALRLLEGSAAARALGEASSPPGLFVRDALTLDPTQVLKLWAPQVLRARAAALKAEGEGWAVLDAEGAAIDRAPIVCLAGGAAGLGLLGGDLDVAPLRGQVSVSVGSSWTGTPASLGGYAAPTREGFLFGATHDRGCEDDTPRAADNLRNLAVLERMRPALAARAGSVSGRASVRAVTPDHLPVCGRAPGRPGVFILTGLGGRGFSTAPLLAEVLAAEALGAPTPLGGQALSRMDPARRRLRRAGGPGDPGAP